MSRRRTGPSRVQVAMICGNCHRWTTANPSDGYLQGWLVRRGQQRPIDVPVFRRGELVLLDDAGGFAPALRGVA